MDTQRTNFNARHAQMRQEQKDASPVTLLFLPPTLSSVLPVLKNTFSQMETVSSLKKRRLRTHAMALQELQLSAGLSSIRTGQLSSLVFLMWA